MTTDSETAGAAAPTDWQSRAAAAEQKLAEMESRLAAAAGEIKITKAALDTAERRRQIERELAASETVDLETAALLTEAAVSGMSKPDVAAAVADLRRRKPFLFRTAPHASAMSAVSARITADPLGEAAGHARATGDRMALLRYLRMKRGK